MSTCIFLVVMFVVFFKQKTAYEMRISDWSSDVCSSDLLMAKDILGAHARDELGISEVTTACPIQAALTSAATFAVGAAMPLAMVLLMPRSLLEIGRASCRERVCQYV